MINTSGCPMPLDPPYWPNDPAVPPKVQPDNRKVAEGIDDWFVPEPGTDAYPDDWVVPQGAHDGTSYPDDWVVPAQPPNATSTTTTFNAQSGAGPPPGNSSAQTVAGTNAAPFDPLESFFSLMPASRS